MKYINMHKADALLGMAVKFLAEFRKWGNIWVAISSKIAGIYAS